MRTTSLLRRVFLATAVASLAPLALVAGCSGRDPLLRGRFDRPNPTVDTGIDVRDAPAGDAPRDAPGEATDARADAPGDALPDVQADAGADAPDDG